MFRALANYKPQPKTPSRVYLALKLRPKVWVVVSGMMHILSCAELEGEVKVAKRTQEQMDKGVYPLSIICNPKHNKTEWFDVMYHRCQVDTWYDRRGRKHRISGMKTAFGHGKYPLLANAKAAARLVKKLAPNQPDRTKLPAPEERPDPTSSNQGWPLGMDMRLAIGGGTMLAFDLMRRFQVLEAI